MTSSPSFTLKRNHRTRSVFICCWMIASKNSPRSTHAEIVRGWLPAFVMIVRRGLSVFFWIDVPFYTVAYRLRDNFFSLLALKLRRRSVCRPTLMCSQTPGAVAKCGTCAPHDMIGEYLLNGRNIWSSLPLPTIFHTNSLPTAFGHRASRSSPLSVSSPCPPLRPALPFPPLSASNPLSHAPSRTSPSLILFARWDRLERPWTNSSPWQR